MSERNTPGGFWDKIDERVRANRVPLTTSELDVVEAWCDARPHGKMERLALRALAELRQLRRANAELTEENARLQETLKGAGYG